MSESDDELAERARARVGQTFCGKYRIERVLGVGGMAFVYVATHRNGRRVAIKMLHPELSLRADIRKRFLQEARAANAVNHPGAVVIIDDDVAEDGAAFLVMELLEGQSIEELWRAQGGSLPTRTVLAIARGLCDVLVEAHGVGIIHRDLKPANLFLTTAGQVKVLDFGLARVRDGTAGANATATGLVFGTPAFLPPEQAAGLMSKIDARTDLWAVGATMFTLLTGETVHDGESAQNLVVLAATKPPRSLASLLPYGDPKVLALVDRALAFERDDRWSSAREMRDAIEAIGEDLAGATVGLVTASEVSVEHPTAPQDSDRTALRLWPVGTRTSAPVSSSAPTQPQAPKQSSSRAAIIVDRAITAFSMSTVAWRRRAGAAALVGVGVAVGVVLLGVRLWDSHAVAHDVVADSAATASVEPIPLPATSPSAEPASTVTLPVLESLTSAAASASPSAPVPKVTQTRRAPRPAPARPRPPEREKDCTQEYTFDANGKKIWKPECVR